MKISVIVPVYNTKKYLKKCLESLVNQTLENIEIILVNDGSTDNSKEILGKYESKYPKKIKVFNKENGGQATARNFGIEKAKGEYIVFVDSDDYIEIDALEKLYNTAKEDKADIVLFDYYEGNEKTGYKIVNVSKWEEKNEVKNYLLSNLGPCNKLIKREILIENNIRFLEGYIYEDLATVPIFGVYANKISYLQKPLYYYEIRSGSTMRQMVYNKKLESIFVALEHLEKEFKERQVYKKYEKELEYIYIDNLLFAGFGRFLKYKEGKTSLNKIIKIINDKFPKWKQNKYYLEKTLRYRLTCKIFMSKSRILIGMYSMARKVIK